MLSELYFLNSKELSKRLAEESISEKLIFLHFLPSAILSGAVVSLPIDMQWAGKEPSSFFVQVLTFITMGIVQYWGFSRAYEINKQIDNKDFFLRYAALNLPISIQTIIYSFFIVIVYGAVIGAIAGSSNVAGGSIIWSCVGVALGASLAVLYFKLLFSAFNQIKAYKNSEIL